MDERLYHAYELTANPNVVHNNDPKRKPRRSRCMRCLLFVQGAFDKSNNVSVYSRSHNRGWRP